jgi:hypothetical protein
MSLDLEGKNTKSGMNMKGDYRFRHARNTKYLRRLTEQGTRLLIGYSSQCIATATTEEPESSNQLQHPKHGGESPR